ncbi:hypothetical protein EJB05_56258, partial [Eragrostis curvula]
MEMEMEAAPAPAPAAKKSRPAGEAPEEQDKDATGSQSPHELQSRSHPRPKTCESEGTGGVDRISGLPDEILGEIISLLPTKDGARAQSLASRWRHLWLSAPLNIDHSDLPSNGDVQAGIISRILAAHRGPSRRLSVSMSHLIRRPETFIGWLQSPALHNLQELEFHQFFWCHHTSLPASAFWFSATLRVATISSCRLPDDVVKKLHFPQLKHLGLEFVKISDGALHSLIAGCHVLEHLLLIGDCFKGLRINSPSIISIGMGSGELIIEDAPSLLRLILLNPCCKLEVISAPKLETLGSLSDQGFDHKFVFGTLVIQSEVSKNRNFWRRKHRNLIRCLDMRLKTIVLKNYRGTKSQLSFASFFVLNAKLLELMIFEGEVYKDDQISIAKQHRLLQLEKRASIGARQDPATQFGSLIKGFVNIYFAVELDFLLLSVKTSPPLPASAFPFSATLRVATIKECHLPDDVVETLHFPQLKQLKLGSVKISDGALHSLIAGGCPVLECLLLDGGYCIRINSPNITSIGMGSGELIIEDAPSLVRLILLDPDVRLNVISAPRLETLGCYSDGDHNTNMVFGTLAIQKLCAVTLMTGVPSIKVLAIHMHDLSLDTVINLMRCFPCLEKLYVKSDISRNRNSWRRKHHNLIRSLDVRLKTVVLKHYRGTQSQVNFASFFVLNAKLLELMRFEGEIQDDDHISITKQQMLLQLEKRASVGMQVSFTARCRYVHKLSHIKNVRDLSTTNPFECTC